MIIFFFLGIFSSSQSVGYPLIVENNIDSIAGTVSSVASIIIMGGGALFKILYGWILNVDWSGRMLNNVPLYSGTSFESAMTLLPLSFFIALIITLFIRETYCKKIN